MNGDDTRSRLSFGTEDAAGIRPEGRRSRGWTTRLRRRLRGRVMLTVLLGVTLAGAGGAAAWGLGQKLYSSRGLVRVVPVLPVVLRPTDEKGLMPMYDSFVEAQMAFIRSQRVAEMAANSPAWRALGRPGADAAIRYFNERLKTDRDGEIIVVELSDPDPRAAMIAVKAAIDAYVRLHVESDAKNSGERSELLEQRRATLDREYNSLRQQIRTIAERYGTDDLLPLYDRKLADVAAAERSLKAADALIQIRAGGKEAIRDDLAESVASADPRLADYFREREFVERKLTALRSQYGDQYGTVIQARQELEAIEASIARYVANASESEAKARCETAKAELLELGRSQLQIAGLKEQSEDRRSRLDETNRRIEQLNIESALAGRINVVSDGERPLSPRRDTRPLFAAGGIFLGAGLAAALMLGLGFLDRRIRFPDDTPSDPGGGDHRLLGVLPEFSGDLMGSESTDAVAHTVRRITTLLQLAAGSSGTRAVAIVGAESLTGKTALTLCLGRAFANGQGRTLLIDCDLTTAGLTSRLTAGRKGLTTSAGSPPRAGLFDVMAGAPLDACVTETHVPGLFLLPAGTPPANGRVGVSPVAMQQVLAEARRRFDAVLIDTAVLPLSLEALAVAAVADAVLLVVSRGDHRATVERCLRELSVVRADVAGVVFNRAARRDVVRATGRGVPKAVPAPAASAGPGAASIEPDTGPPYLDVAGAAVS